MDVRPEAPVGDLISDEAWHSDWCVAELESHTGLLTAHVGERAANHVQAGAHLATCTENHASLFVTAASEKSREYLSADEKITEQYQQGIALNRQISNYLVTARTQMTAIATYAAGEIKTLEASGETDKADNVRKDAVSEIKGISDDLTTTIDAAIASLGADV